jgi:serine/threonine protein kinase
MPWLLPDSLVAMPYIEHSPGGENAPLQRVAPEAEIEDGRYELVHWIGAGGMAQVWLARRPIYGGEQLVAIKLIAESHRGNLEYERLFRREAKLSMRLNHSNIVQAHDLCRVEGRMGLVMEWVDGIDLGQLLRHLRRCEQLLSIELAAFIVGEVLTGLAHAHAQRGPGGQPIVHCDITPQNVLLSCNGEVKIADYGIAESESESESERAASTALRGTLRYMAPEQATGERRGAEVDLYAVGAIFHEMLAGRRFRDQVAREDLLEAVMDGAIPPLSRATPPELLELCRSLLAPVIDDRILSAPEALAMLFASGHHRDCRIELAALVSAIVETSTEDPSMVSMTPIDATHTQTWGEEGGARMPGRTWPYWQPWRRSQLSRKAVRVGVGAGLCVALGLGAQAWLGPTGSGELDASVLVVDAASHDAAADSASVQLYPHSSSFSLTTVDGRPVAGLAGPIRLDPGVHTIQVHDSRGGWEWAMLEVEAGVDYQVEMKRERAGQASTGSRP